jgi:Holliday junction resolvase RusA-like endonuclease
MISFFVQGEPKGQPRPRASMFRNAGRPRVFDPGTAENWKSLIMVEAKAFRDQLPIEGPICLAVEFHFTRPKNHFQIRRGELAGVKAAAPLWKEAKPDIDNLLKAVMDALTQVGAWRDDAQVCETVVRKKFCELYQAQGAQITISRLEVTPAPLELLIVKKNEPDPTNKS